MNDTEPLHPPSPSSSVSVSLGSGLNHGMNGMNPYPAYYESLFHPVHEYGSPGVGSIVPGQQSNGQHSASASHSQHSLHGNANDLVDSTTTTPSNEMNQRRVNHPLVAYTSPYAEPHTLDPHAIAYVHALNAATTAAMNSLMPAMNFHAPEQIKQSKKRKTPPLKSEDESSVSDYQSAAEEQAKRPKLARKRDDKSESTKIKSVVKETKRKMKKNNREKQRRAELNVKFDELSTLLEVDALSSLSRTIILTQAIDTINSLRSRLIALGETP